MGSAYLLYFISGMTGVTGKNGQRVDHTFSILYIIYECVIRDVTMPTQSTR